MVISTAKIPAANFSTFYLAREEPGNVVLLALGAGTTRLATHCQLTLTAFFSERVG